MNVAQGAAVCGIPVSPTETCGVQAIGRCATCKRAFCTSHMAFHSNTGWLVNMCAPCFAETSEQVALAKRVKEAEERDAAQRYFSSGAARAALLAAGVPTVELYKVEQHLRPGLFRNRKVEEVTPIGRGWVLGEFRWRFPTAGITYPDGVYVQGTTALRNCLTALQDTSEYGLVAVYPYSGGYAYHMDTRGILDFIRLMQAVKRLAGESS